MDRAKGTRELMQDAAARASGYLESLAERVVAPSPEALERLAELGGSLPDGPLNPIDVLAMLDEIGSPATVASTGGRYFGFVIGGALPAALAANWLAGAWDQNAAFAISSPIGASLEKTALEWLLELLGLPPRAGGGFVTGATMANFTCLAAARHALLARAGVDVEEDGLVLRPAGRGPPVRRGARDGADRAPVPGPRPFAPRDGRGGRPGPDRPRFACGATGCGPGPRAADRRAPGGQREHRCLRPTG